MAVQSAALTVAATATLVVAAPGAGIDVANTVWAELYNPGPTTIYLGGAGVTVAQGRPVATGESWSFPLAHGEALYAIAASGTQAIRVFRGRV